MVIQFAIENDSARGEKFLKLCGDVRHSGDWLPGARPKRTLAVLNDGDATMPVQLRLNVSRVLDLLPMLVVGLCQHRINATSDEVGIDLLLLGVLDVLDVSLLDFLLPLRLGLSLGLLERSSLVSLTDVLALADNLRGHLLLAIDLTIGSNDQRPLRLWALRSNLNLPHLDLAGGCKLVKGGKLHSHSIAQT